MAVLKGPDLGLFLYHRLFSLCWYSSASEVHIVSVLARVLKRNRSDVMYTYYRFNRFACTVEAG